VHKEFNEIGVALFFSVVPGFDAMVDQNICNKIMVKLIQNYGNIFETSTGSDKEDCTEEHPTLVIVKVFFSHCITRC